VDAVPVPELVVVRVADVVRLLVSEIVWVWVPVLTLVSVCVPAVVEVPVPGRSRSAGANGRAGCRARIGMVPADVVVPVQSGDVVVVCVAQSVTPGGGQQVRLMQFTVYVFVFRRVSVRFAWRTP